MFSSLASLIQAVRIIECTQEDSEERQGLIKYLCSEHKSINWSRFALQQQHNVQFNDTISLSEIPIIYGKSINFIQLAEVLKFCIFRFLKEIDLTNIELSCRSLLLSARHPDSRRFLQYQTGKNYTDPMYSKITSIFCPKLVPISVSNPFWSKSLRKLRIYGAFANSFSWQRYCQITHLHLEDFFLDLSCIMGLIKMKNLEKLTLLPRRKPEFVWVLSIPRINDNVQFDYLKSLCINQNVLEYNTFASWLFYRCTASDIHLKFFGSDSVFTSRFSQKIKQLDVPNSFIQNISKITFEGKSCDFFEFLFKSSHSLVLSKKIDLECGFVLNANDMTDFYNNVFLVFANIIKFFDNIKLSLSFFHDILLLEDSLDDILLNTDIVSVFGAQISNVTMEVYLEMEYLESFDNITFDEENVNKDIECLLKPWFLLKKISSIDVWPVCVFCYATSSEKQQFIENFQSQYKHQFEIKFFCR